MFNKPVASVIDLTQARRERLRKKIFGYVGIVRPYSLIDLIFQLVAVQAAWRVGIGAISLWLGFLFFLEWLHEDRGRVLVPEWCWVICWGFGLGTYWHIEGPMFCLLSVGYAAKIYPYAGLVSPFLRGLLNFMLLGGIIGYGAWQPQVALITTIIRNLIGDLRDLRKDNARGTLTIPLALGLDTEWSHAHRWATHLTTFLWWLATPIPWWGLLLAWWIQFKTYTWTPR